MPVPLDPGELRTGNGSAKTPAANHLPISHLRGGTEERKIVNVRQCPEESHRLSHTNSGHRVHEWDREEEEVGSQESGVWGRRRLQFLASFAS